MPTNIQIAGYDFPAQVVKDYEALELVKVDITLGPDRHSVLLFTYEEMDSYREAYDKDIE